MSQENYYLDRFSSNSDSAIFLIFAFTGMIWQLVTRVLLDPGLSLFPVILGLSALLFLYFWIIVRSPHSRQVRERGGDNLYFLGFIYTAVTFGIALYKVGLDAEQDISFILSDLGIGLTTTILGLVLRIATTLVKTGTEDIEEVVYSNLKQQADELEKRFVYAAQSAEKANVLTTQIIEEANDSIRKTVANSEELIKELNESTAKSIQDNLERTNSAMKRIATELDAVEIPKDMVTSKIAPALQYFVSSVSTISGKLTESAAKLETEVSSSLRGVQGVRNHVVLLNSSMKILNENVNEASELIIGFKRNVDSLERTIDENVNALAGQINSIEIDDQSLSDSLSSAITKSANSYNEAVESLAAKITEMSAPFDQTAESIESYLDRIEGVLGKHIGQELSVGVENLNKEISTLFTELHGKLTSIQNDLKNITKDGTSTID